MLTLFIAHIIITACCLCSGFLFYMLFPDKDTQKPIIFYLLSGLILLTAVVQITVLFFPINLSVQIIIVSILLISALFKIKEFKTFLNHIVFLFLSLNRILQALYLVIWLIILLINSGPTMMDDTESYHIQSIKWIQEYGSVPGLVNLHERFGFNSSWFGSIALFNFFKHSAGGFTALNSVLSLWLSYWFISKCNHLQKEKKMQAALAILTTFIICLAIWPLIRGNAATANYDFIITVVVLILFVEIFLSKEFSPSQEWIIWPVYLFTVRVITFPVLLLGLTALIFFIRQKNARQYFMTIAYCLLLVMPCIIRTVIISGYPFYPVTNFDLANADWKPDPQITKDLFEYIKYYNRVSTTYLDIEQTKALGANWVPSWFKYLFPFDKILVLSGLSGIFLSIAKQSVRNNKSKLLLLFISIIWVVSWFFIAPDPRFIYGILLFGNFLFFYWLSSFIKNTQITKASISILAMIVLASASYYYFSKLLKQKEHRNWISPARLLQPPVKEFVIDGIIIRVPERINNNWNARCYGTQLPCLYNIDTRLKARGKNIRDGFRLEK